MHFSGIVSRAFVTAHIHKTTKFRAQLGILHPKSSILSIQRGEWGLPKCGGQIQCFNH